MVLSVCPRVAITSQRPQGEKFVVAVVLQIKKLGKTRRVETVVVPETVGLLISQQIVHAVRYLRAVVFLSGQQSHDGQGRMKCGTAFEFTANPGVVIANIALAPAAIGALLGFQPNRGSAHAGVVRCNAGCGKSK